MLEVSHISKSFTLHNQGAAQFGVFNNVSFEVKAGECVVILGESGEGKSSLLRCLYANYAADEGSIILHHGEHRHDLSAASDREMIRLRREKIAYVSQFLRVIPRVPAFEVVLQPLLDVGMQQAAASERVDMLLTRLNIPRRLWSLSPTTFSGGEQQRINIAREFAVHRPLMLLDEPTASLDENNRLTVIELILEAKRNNSAIVAIFHDDDSRTRVADKLYNLKNGILL